MERDVPGCVERLVDVVAGHVPLIGAYVHGSAVLGGFVPGRSDVDVLIVVDDVVDDEVELGRQLAAVADPCPGRGVELSVVTREQAAANAEPWPFVVHVATGSGDPRIVPGRSMPGDHDLLMHYAVAVAAGEAVTGPPPADVFGESRRDDVLAYLAAELTECLEGVSEAYVVLNACRAWQYASTGEFVSKVSGASWAKDRDGPMVVIGHALSARVGQLPDRPITPDAERFVRSVIERLR